MRKGEGNPDRVTARVGDSPRRDPNSVSANRHASADFDNQTAADKPDRIQVEELVPFLEERIAFKIPSETSRLNGVLDYLNERMLTLGIVNPGDSEVLIALDEAIVNAIKHGNKSDPRKAVHIVAEFSAGGARFSVTDEGAGFCREEVPDPTQPCRLLEPSGRGLLLINHIMDEVCFNPAGNSLEMFKRAVNKRQPEGHSSNLKNTGSEG